MKKIKYSERKKYIIRGLSLIILGIISLGLVIYFNITNKDTNPFETDNSITDAVKFKKEYESLNQNEDMLSIKVDKDNPMKYLVDEELKDFLDSGTGIIYFGFNECPWCRNAVPVLIDALKERNIKEAYYLDVKDIRDEKKLDEEGKIITTKEGSDSYKLILEKLNSYLPSYEGLNDESIKRLYVPAVLFMKNGEIVGIHSNTVESQTDPSIPLNEEQYKELKNIYLNNIDKVYNFNCSDGC